MTVAATLALARFHWINPTDSPSHVVYTEPVYCVFAAFVKPNHESYGLDGLPYAEVKNVEFWLMPYATKSRMTFMLRAWAALMKP